MAPSGLWSPRNLLDGSHPALQHFTNEARKVLTVVANQETWRLKHEYLGTEHLLLAILGERDCVGAGILMSLGLDLEAARQAVERLIRPGGEPVPIREPAWTPRAKTVVELAIGFARDLHHGDTGTEHILLGLTSEIEGLAGQLLASWGGTSAGTLRAIQKEAIARRRDPDSPGSIAGTSLQIVSWY